MFKNLLLFVVCLIPSSVKAQNYILWPYYVPYFVPFYQKMEPQPLRYQRKLDFILSKEQYESERKRIMSSEKQSLKEKREPSFGFNGKKYKNYQEFKNSDEFLKMLAQKKYERITKQAAKELIDRRNLETMGRTSYLRNRSFYQKKRDIERAEVDRIMGYQWQHGLPKYKYKKNYLVKD